MLSEEQYIDTGRKDCGEDVILYGRRRVINPWKRILNLYLLSSIYTFRIGDYPNPICQHPNSYSRALRKGSTIQVDITGALGFRPMLISQSNMSAP